MMKIRIKGMDKGHKLVSNGERGISSKTDKMEERKHIDCIKIIYLRI